MEDFSHLCVVANSERPKSSFVIVRYLSALVALIAPTVNVPPLRVGQTMMIRHEQRAPVRMKPTTVESAFVLRVSLPALSAKTFLEARQRRQARL